MIASKFRRMSQFWEKKIWWAPIYWRPGSIILEPLLVKNMFFVLFSNMNHGELNVPSPFGRPSCDTQNLVLSELYLFIPFHNIENKTLISTPWIFPLQIYLKFALQYHWLHSFDENRDPKQITHKCKFDEHFGPCHI